MSKTKININSWFFLLLKIYIKSFIIKSKMKESDTVAKLEKELIGNFDEILNKIEVGIINGSMSASLEDKSDFIEGSTRCSVRVFERYSYLGNNRVSLSVTLFQSGNNPIQLSAITSGGSTAILFKFNTIGEENFLKKLEDIL